MNTTETTAPVSRQVVVCLARIANDLDTLKNCFKRHPDDRVFLTLAVKRLHDVAMAHDAAGGYGRYAIEVEEGVEGEPDDADFVLDDPLHKYPWDEDLDLAEFEMGQEATA